MVEEFKNFKQRLQDLLLWNKIRTLLIIDSLIALLLFVIFSSMLEGDYKHILFECFLFSHAIGTSIYVFIQLTNIANSPKVWTKSFSLTGVLILGGWSGTLIGSVINYLIFGHNLAMKPFKSMFLTNTLLALFFGSIVTLYFFLREKLEETAAKLAEKEVNEQRLLQLNTKIELEALRAKVNPHFLFNTLNSIASLIPVNPEKAEEMVQKLSHLFRYTLEASNRQSMKLDDELQIIKEYLEIEKIRLGERLTYHIEMETNLAGIAIPGLLLQTLVENSVKHGISSSKERGYINVKCTQEERFCRIEVNDSGNGFKELEFSQGFGLNSIRERLTLYYETDYEFQVSTDDGVNILIRIPLIQYVS